MKLHKTVVEELVRIFQIHGGHREEWRLQSELSKIDLTTYNQQTTGNQILVLTKHLQKELLK
jgi:hypothetical protein